MFQNYQKEEKEAAQFAKKQRSYKLLDAADDEGDDRVPSTSATSQPGKMGSHQKRFRKKSETQESEDDEA